MLAALTSDSASFFFIFFPSRRHSCRCMCLKTRSIYSLHSTQCPDPFFHSLERMAAESSFVANNCVLPVLSLLNEVLPALPSPLKRVYFTTLRLRQSPPLSLPFPPPPSFLFVRRERATIALNHLGSHSNEENTILCVLVGMHITRRSRVCMIGHAEPADFWRQ